jgi:ATP-dependent DNA ligase
MSKPARSKITASFVEPMLCLSTSSLPEGEGWSYELKLDGYRAIAIKKGRTVQLRSGTFPLGEACHDLSRDHVSIG